MSATKIATTRDNLQQLLIPNTFVGVQNFSRGKACTHATCTCYIITFFHLTMNVMIDPNYESTLGHS